MSKWQGVYDNISNSPINMNSFNIDFFEEYNDGEEIPNTFSILTYNIWGLSINDNLKKLFSLRKDMIELTIRNSNADLVCIQEMSDYSYNLLSDLVNEYKYASEKPYIKQINRKRNADVYFMSKFKPSKITIYGLPGILCYNNSMCVVEYKNLIVFNLYLQSGTKKSPGQANSWIHFSNCRHSLLQLIYNIIISYQNHNKNIVLCGDFNFDLDGSADEWPEIEIINKLKNYGFIDTFKYINPNIDCFTEDTDKNFLRWNLKLIEKKYKFDAIFYKSIDNSNVIKSSIVGDNVLFLNHQDSDWFINIMSDANGNYNKLKGIDNCSLIPINPSDHFGILTKISKN